MIQNSFHTNGSNIIDALGNIFKMRGINHEHSWFKQDIIKAVQSIALTNANVIRIVLSNGVLYTKDTVEEVKNIINLCTQNQLITILEVHDGTGSDNITILNGIIEYWKEIKSSIINCENRVIINIANEWYPQNNSSVWAEAYKQVIPALRANGINNMLIVDCAGWGQYPNTIVETGKDIIKSDPIENVVFSIHMYENAGRNSDVIKSSIDNILRLDIPVIVGEFGHSHDNIIVDSDTIVSYCESQKVGWLGWSWYGNSPATYLDMTNPANGSLTTWGEFIVYSQFGTKNTSQKCSIFN